MEILNVMPLFPKTAVVGNLSEVDNDHLIKNVEEKFKDKKYYKEYDKFYSSDPNLHLEEDYKDFCETILNFTKVMCSDIFCYVDLEPKITLMWATGTLPGTTIHRHYHPNSFFSGVYYPQNIQYSSIRFKNPHNPTIFPRFNNHNLYNSTSMEYTPEQGSVIIFPSDLEHDVLPNVSDQMRISIAFNIFFSGKFGLEDSLSYLEMT